VSDSVSGTTDDRVAADHDAAVEPVEQVEVKGLERRRGVRSVLTSRALAWTIALLSLAVAVFAGMQWADLYAAERERTQVREAARTAATRLTTFEGTDIENWYASALETATGEYGEQLREVFNQETRDQLRQIEAVSRGEVENLFVQEVQGDEARAFALVTQTYANTSTSDPVEDNLRMDITLRRVEEQWLASEVAVLGPSGVIAPTGTPTDPAAGGDQ
jgi:Mce-associated membrane protein